MNRKFQITGFLIILLTIISITMPQTLVGLGVALIFGGIPLFLSVLLVLCIIKFIKYETKKRKNDNDSLI